MSPVFDIAIAGGGLSGGETLRMLLAGWDRTPQAKRPAVLVIERGSEMWTGAPYGRKASWNCMVLTDLRDFLAPDEAADFVGWLRQNQDDWMQEWRENEKEAFEKWRRAFAGQLEDDWHRVYFPRRLFGRYLRQRLQNAIREAEKKQLADIVVLHDELVDVDRSEDLFGLKFAKAPEARARKLVLAPGSPANGVLPGSRAGDGRIVNDPYDPSIGETLQKVAQLLAEAGKEDRQVLIVGSNASAIELVNLISHEPGLRRLEPAITLISRTGVLPLTEHNEAIGDNGFFPAMSALQAAHKVTADALISSVEADIQNAAETMPNLAATAEITKRAVELLGRLDDAQQMRFHRLYGMRLSALFRRAGSWYTDSYRSMMAAGQLEAIAGEFIGLIASSADLGMRYRSGGKELGRRGFRVAINCAGFTNLNDPAASGLLAKMRDKGLVRINESGRGLEVDGLYQASPGIFVIGPLLAGNFNERVRLWHVEKASRITSLAADLAPILGS